MRDMGMSLKDVYKEETPQNLTSQFVEELAEGFRVFVSSSTMSKMPRTKEERGGME